MSCVPVRCAKIKLYKDIRAHRRTHTVTFSNCNKPTSGGLWTDVDKMFNAPSEFNINFVRDLLPETLIKFVENSHIFCPI